VCPHVHLPLQSGSDRVLKAMNRTYDVAAFRDVVKRLREAIPGVALSTDIIVGFPGEEPDDFQATVDRMEEIRFDSAFLFKYSARPDTRAYRWPETVTEEEKGRRLTRLIDLQHAWSGEIHDRLLGATLEALVEGPARRGSDDAASAIEAEAGRGAGQLYGKSPQFKTVVFPDDGTPPGTLVNVRVIGSTPVTLLGARAGAPRLDPALVQIG